MRSRNPSVLFGAAAVILVVTSCRSVVAQSTKSVSGVVTALTLFDSAYGHSRHLWSAGGLASAYVALERPDLFGNVLSQSGAFWRGPEASNRAPYEWLTTRVRTMPKRDVIFFLDVGALEDHATLGGSGPNFRDTNRRFRDALLAKGYKVSYTEVPGGQYAPVFWRPRLPIGIVALTQNWR